MSLPGRALILARISDAEWVITSEGARVLDPEGVNSQVADLLDLAEDLRWTVGPADTHHVIENDVSAFRVRMVVMPDGHRERRPKRPRFWEALAMLNDGRADGALTVDLDRTARHPRDLESLIDVVELRKVPVVDLAGEIDLTTNEGRGNARNKVARANAASADTSRRVARKYKRYAANGRYLGGPRRFGFRTEGPAKGRYLVVEEEEAEIIRGMADQVLSGVSLRQVALDLRKRGIKTTKGVEWSSISVRTLLLNPAIAGLLTYRPAHPAGTPQTAQSRLYTDDQIIGPAPWSEIISEDDWRGVRAILLDPSRRSSPGSTPRHLLSMIATCGKTECGGFMAVSKNRRGQLCYRCKSCGGPRRLVAMVDAYVSMVITGILASPRAADLLPVSGLVPGDGADLRRERAALRQRLDEQARLHAEGIIDARQLAEGSKTLRTSLDAADRQLQAQDTRSPLAGIAGHPDAARVWESMSLGRKRAIIKRLADITFMPAAPGPEFDPTSIVITPRGV